MKYYTSLTEYNCGIDLHAHQMYVCVMDRQGKKLVHCNIKDNNFDYFLTLIKPYRHSITICSECMFGWYWLADACQTEGPTRQRKTKTELPLRGPSNGNETISVSPIFYLLTARA